MNVETNFGERLARGDNALWDAVPSSATAADRRVLLALQAGVRAPGYAYVEIGSEMGGSLQVHLADPWCAKVFSIDLRVTAVVDYRGTRMWYNDNTTAGMRARLGAAFSAAQMAKLETFDAAAPEVAPALITVRPRLVFIDAEHTDEAAWRDFCWARGVVEADGWIAFHDASLVRGAVLRAVATLRREGQEHAVGRFRGSSVLVVALGAGAAARVAGLSGAVGGLGWFAVVSPWARRRARLVARVGWIRWHELKRRTRPWRQKYL